MPGSSCHRPQYWWAMQTMFLLVPFVAVVAVVAAVVVSFMSTFPSANGARSFFHIFLALLPVPALLSLFRVSLSVLSLIFDVLKKQIDQKRGFEKSTIFYKNFQTR